MTTHPDFEQPEDCNPNPEPLEWFDADDNPLLEESETQNENERKDTK